VCFAFFAAKILLENAEWILKAARYNQSWINHKERKDRKEKTL
jgi:hypothetical protein